MTGFRDMILERTFQTVPGVAHNRERHKLLERADIVPVTSLVGLLLAAASVQFAINGLSQTPLFTR